MKHLGLVAALSSVVFAFSGAAQAQNFDHATQVELVEGCKADLPKRIGQPLPDPTVTLACSCVIDHLQSTPSEDEIDWEALVTILKTGSVKATDAATANAGALAGFYPVLLKDQNVVACMSKARTGNGN